MLNTEFTRAYARLENVFRMKSFEMELTKEISPPFFGSQISLSHGGTTKC